MVALESLWKEYETVREPDITDLSLENVRATKRISKTSILFSILGIVVLALSLMNLFGMAVMFANSKLKNICIRKVLGAHAAELFRRLSAPFAISLLIAVTMALPLGYYFMEKYLQRYAYRINLDISQGIAVGVLLVMVVYLVIGFKMLQFSKSNPAEILKNE